MKNFHTLGPWHLRIALESGRAEMVTYVEISGIVSNAAHALISVIPDQTWVSYHRLYPVSVDKRERAVWT